LLESKDRVHTMALLHESLYRSQNFSQINLSDYVRELVTHLFRSYGIDAAQIGLEMKLAPLHLIPDAAVACGLILNELVSNALKYAFAGGRKGTVRIELSVEPNNQVKLVVADNGIGLQSHPDLETATTLGLRLVRSLAEQLGGTVQLRSDGGTQAELVFPIPR